MNEYIKELKILRTEITTLKNAIGSLKKSNSAQFAVEFETDEDGNIKLDKDGYPIIKESTIGKFSKLIIDEFNWSNVFGTQIHLVSNKPTALDYHYVGRTLIFEQITTNSITKNGKVVNSTPVRK